MVAEVMVWVLGGWVGGGGRSPSGGGPVAHPLGDIN